jgi:hypothetical protein
VLATASPYPTDREARMRRVLVAFLTTVALDGCGVTAEPASTDMSSDALPTLERRVEFLERYVTFRRTYTDLTFHVVYHNNGGGLVPAPSEWDIRFVAVIPPTEVGAWVPPDSAAKPTTDARWLADVPGSERAAKISEWYTAPGLVVGIDRERSVVAYRRWKR